MTFQNMLTVERNTNLNWQYKTCFTIHNMFYIAILNQRSFQPFMCLDIVAIRIQMERKKKRKKQLRDGRHAFLASYNVATKQKTDWFRTKPSKQVARGGARSVTTKNTSCNRRSSEIQGTALGKSLRAWTCIYRSMPAGAAQSRHAFVGGIVQWARGEDDGYP